MNFPAGAIGDRKTRVVRAAGSRAPGEPFSAPASTACLPLDRFRAEPGQLGRWQELEPQGQLPMQSPAFVGAVADHLAAMQEIQVHYVEQGGCLTALLPLSAGHGLFGRLRVVGEDELGEPIDILCTDSGAARRLAEAIVQNRMVLDLDRLPAGSPLIAALQEAIRGNGRMSVRPARPTPTITLDEGWKDPASRFNSGRRSDFRRAGRKAAEFGETSFEILSPTPDQFDRLFDEAIGVEARSWKREIGTAIVVDRCKEQFFRDYFRAACARGEFRFAFMRIDGQLVAMQMAVESLDRYWLFKIGFDEAFARCSPGTLLMLHTIGWAAQRELHAYELLGHVEPWIAQLWTREQHDCVRLRLYPYNVRGGLALVADALFWLCKRLTRAAR